MKRADLEHIIRAAAAITNQYEIVVVGSQSILGAWPNPPEFLAISTEADVYPLQRPDLADLIDGAMGEGSVFHETFDYYAQGVGPETAVLPEGWQERLVTIQNSNTDLKIGYCLDPHDLAVSKLIANREKDKAFVEHMLLHKMIDPAVLLQRLRRLVEQLGYSAAQTAALNLWVTSRIK